MKKRTKKPKKLFRVYVTYYPNGNYYIGFTTKEGKALDKYFGSNKEILALVKENPDTHGLTKDIIYVSEKRSFARMQEFLLQWQQRFDPYCLNDMINIRLRSSYLKEFHPLTWSPRPLEKQLELSFPEI